MELLVLGTGNAFNQQSRLNSSYLIDFNKSRILVDCGFTVPLALQKNKIDFSSITHVFITHYHGDHFAGLAAILLGLRYVSVQKQKLTIVGPKNIKEKTNELLRVLYSGTEKLLDELNIEFLSVKQSGGTYETREFSFEVDSMKHSELASPVAYSFRLDQSVGFSGDTCWHDGLEDFVSKNDKIILECNFTQKVGEGHLSVEELNDSKVIQDRKQDIFLTHVYEASSELAVRNGYRVLEDLEKLTF